MSAPLFAISRSLLMAATLAITGPSLSAPPPVTAPPGSCFARCHDDLHEDGATRIHPDAVDGCETCHGRIGPGKGPHADPGRTAKGLRKDPPALCHECHDRKDFEGARVHAPVASGPCRECHVPHASPHTGLLRKQATALCLECHDDVLKKPHFVAGAARADHPLGAEKSARPVPDPLRPGRAFGCVSCHDPHSSANRKLLRMDKKGPGGFCSKCHAM